MGHNSKTIAWRVMSLVLQLHVAMMSRCFLFGVDTLILFEKWAALKFLHNDDDVTITIALFSLWKANKNYSNTYFIADTRVSRTALHIHVLHTVNVKIRIYTPTIKEFPHTWILSLCMICFCNRPLMLKLQMMFWSNLIITNVSLDIQIKLAVSCLASGGSSDLNKSPFNVCTRHGPSTITTTTISDHVWWKCNLTVWMLVCLLKCMESENHLIEDSENCTFGRCHKNNFFIQGT